MFAPGLFRDRQVLVSGASGETGLEFARGSRPARRNDIGIATRVRIGHAAFTMRGRI